MGAKTSIEPSVISLFYQESFQTGGLFYNKFRNQLGGKTPGQSQRFRYNTSLKECKNTTLGPPAETGRPKCVVFTGRTKGE